MLNSPSWRSKPPYENTSCAQRKQKKTLFNDLNNVLQCSFLVYKQRNAHACIVVLSWKAVETDPEEKSLNKVAILISFAQKKYSCSCITLLLNHGCHMDYFNNVLTTCLGLERVRKHLDFIKKSYFVFLRWTKSNGFGTTWGWVINDRIFLFGWAINFWKR